MMKKTALTFAALAAAAASFASAENMPQTGGEQGAFPGLQEVQYQGVKLSAKKDDRTKFVYVADSVTPAPAAPAAPAPAPVDPMAAPAGEPTPAAAPAEGTPVEPLPQDPAAVQP
ncbi:hypothetical protein [Neisseria dentiae]|uniref:hypothetical protein n=1 Tax=Neisseria dentiae TaxID=194197 RepID=UPI0035A199E1